MKAPRLTIVRRESSPKWEAYKLHAGLCERCREAVTEIDLCLEGLDLFLDSQGIQALQAFAERLKP